MRYICAYDAVRCDISVSMVLLYFRLRPALKSAYCSGNLVSLARIFLASLRMLWEVMSLVNLPGFSASESTHHCCSILASSILITWFPVSLKYSDRGWLTLHAWLAIAWMTHVSKLFGSGIRHRSSIVPVFERNPSMHRHWASSSSSEYSLKLFHNRFVYPKHKMIK